MWVVKTHDPVCFFINLIFKCHKVVCCVRNPYDTLASNMHYLPVFVQSSQINEKFTEVPEEWDLNIKTVTPLIKNFHNRILKEQAKAVPFYIIRYEDLRTKPQETLEGVFKFILNLPSLDGLNIQRRIKQVVDLGHNASVIYTQKDGLTTSKAPLLFNRQIDQFSAEQQQYINEELKDYMHIFGYCS